MGGIAKHEDFRMAGNRQIRIRPSRCSGPIGVDAEPLAGGGRHHAGRPNDRAGVDAFAFHLDATLVTPRRRLAEMHPDAQHLERTTRRLRQLGMKGGEKARTGLISVTRVARGSIERKSAESAMRASSAIAPAISTPVGPPPTRTKLKRRSRSRASISISAFSNASRIRRRSIVASSMRFRPGANFANRHGRNSYAWRRWR